MIKTIIFDFDGVIVESANIKTEAFRELFAAYPEKIDRIVDYHLLNGGISRYVKFRHIYSRILGQDLQQEEEINLGRRFSQIVLKKVLVTPLVAGVEDFLKMNKGRYQYYVASGTPQEELDRIVQARGLRGYFREVHGSPAKKKDIIEGIIKRHGFKRSQIVLVGDAESDSVAAKDTGVVYIERKSTTLADSENSAWVINDLYELSDMLGKIESKLYAGKTNAAR